MTEHVVPREPIARSMAIITAGANGDDEMVLSLLAEVEASGEFLLPAMAAIGIAFYRFLQQEYGAEPARRLLERIGLAAIDADADIAEIAS